MMRASAISDNALSRNGSFASLRQIFARDNQSLMTSVKLQATVCRLKGRCFVHKGLKRLYQDDNTKGVPPDTADKLRNMFAFLDAFNGPEN